MQLAPVQATAHSGFCALCQSAIEPDVEVTSCPGCGTVYHTECWHEVGGCGVYGCTQVPTTEKRDELSIPAAHWGRETKPCPACNQEIQAMAVRCRHCQADLGGMNPVSAAAWKAGQQQCATKPKLKQRIIWVSVACAVPFIGPVVGLFAGIWRYFRRRDIASLPGLYQAMILIAIALAAVQAIALLLVVSIFPFLKS